MARRELLLAVLACAGLPSRIRLELQAIEADPGAAKGVSFTQGLEMVLGY